MEEAGRSVAHARRLVLAERREHVGIAIERKVRRCHTNNRVADAVENQGLAEHVVGAGKPPAPQSFADQRDRRRARAVLVRPERAAAKQGHADRGDHLG